MLEIVGHVLGGRVALGSPPGERFEADAFQFLRYAIVPLPRRTDIDISDLVQEPAEAVGLEGTQPGQELIKDHAQAKDIRPPIDAMPLATSLFRTEIGRRARHAGALAEIFLQ